MNREQIVAWAREAGFTLQRDERLFTEMLERFFHAAYAAGAAAERNAILQMSREQWFKTQADFEGAIRARESK